jgi:autoinducer 2-degrading protein
MIVNCVYVNVKPDNVKHFVEATRANHMESVKEPGNLRFDIIQQADNRCKFMLYEAYESDIAVANHKTTLHYIEWRNKVESYMAEPRHAVRYNVVEPNDRSLW